MDNQKQFKVLMDKITGEALSNELKGCKQSLKDSCQEMQSALMPCFEINIENGNEPFPFCYSGGDKPAELVWIGLNPGSPLERCKTWKWEDASWRDIIEYCVPTTDIRKRQGENTYFTFLDEAGKELKTDYYRFVLRMHLALLGDEVFDTWKAVQEKYGKGKTAELFLERFATHPVLNAELIPYKSKGINYRIENLLKNHKYMAYFRALFQYAEEISLPNAWFVFFGAPKEVRLLLEKEHSDWNIPKEGDSIMIPDEDGQEFYIFKGGSRKILLSPFIKRYSVNYHISNLVQKMKDFELKL